MQKKIKIIMIIAIILVAFIIIKATNLYNIILKQMYPMKNRGYVEKYAIEYNVDKLLIYSIIKAESNFRETAESTSGAKGLMQLMDATADEIGTKIEKPDLVNKNLLDAEKNIAMGTYYYAYLEKYYEGNMTFALAAYNAGIGNVDEWINNGILNKDGSNIENIPFRETNMYVRKIINNYRMYQKIYDELN